MSRNARLALQLAVAIGITSVPFATSAFAENNYSDWGYWSANDDTGPQAATHLKRDNGPAAFGYSPARAHAHKKVHAR
jgi:hypothetical protein